MTSKKLFGIFILAALSAVALAQGSKVGVVDADVVIQKCEKGKKFFEDYKAFAQGKRDEIEAMVTRFREQEKDFNAKRASLSEDKLREMGSELQKLQTEITRKQEDAKRESDTMLNEGLDKFRKELGPLIRQVALEKDLDLVFNIGPQSNMVYVNESIDITEEVIKKYDEMTK